MKNGKTHIHIQNSRSSVEVFVAKRRQADDLLERNPDLRDRLEITIGSSAVDPVDLWTKEDMDEYYGYMATADILVGYSFPGKDIKKYAPNLRWIHFISSGVEHMTPFDWVPEGLQLVNNRGVHLPKSGESFAMFLYMLNSAMPRLYTAQRNGTWDRAFTSVIRGKKLVVLGVGHQGGEIARMAKKMGLYVTGIHPNRKEHPNCDRMMTNSQMREAFADADFLAIAAPLTEKTRGIIGEEQMGWLPERAGIINISRGPLLDEEALIKNLTEGKLSGAILDVFNTEPLPADSPLWDTPNLIITPHVSSDDVDNYMPLTLDLTIKNLRHELTGEPFENLVDVKKGF